MSRNRRRRPAARVGGSDFWGDDLPTPTPTKITPTDVPTAVVASLGAPPLPGGAAGDGTLAALYDEAVRVATALAAANGLLADPEAED